MAAAMPSNVSDRSNAYFGPGALSSFLLAAVTVCLGLGLPVLYRLREVLQHAQRDSREPSDAILILGRALVDDRPTDVFRARLEHGMQLWSNGVAPRLIVAGGVTGRSTRSEAAVGRETLIAGGVAPDAVFTEDRSRHTLENLFNVRTLVHKHRWHRLTVVSDPLHLARAITLAGGLGLETSTSPATECPPKRNSFRWWLRATKEAFFLHWYFVGMLYSRLIGSQTLLKRVT